MKFTVKMPFKARHMKFEEGNAHDPEVLGIENEAVEKWYNAGWINIEGRDPSPDPVPGVAKVQPRSTTHKRA